MIFRKWLLEPGNIISSKGIEIDPNKKDAVKSFPRRLSPLDMRSSLGLAGYYRRWLELLKDYDISVLYHPGKANVVADAFSRLSDVHRLAQLGVQLVDSTKGGVMVNNGSELSFVADVKAKQCLDPTIVELK
ncbi:hypothetical protein MTR67_026884 [Solanum verrucosum]|uniref:Uncharacterized protein n=1 Tax=Solanum verrucosum TaxID=315347 RepID=A0AAF0R8K9_SOLVR|nr:hypothetical protein MTR67_026884 [Solanum verrucosum]